MLGGGDEAHKFMGRPRFDRTDFASMMNPASRQIYLTFPADSTFREEDVSNYFRYACTHANVVPRPCSMIDSIMSRTRSN
jgi:hypothetical protein